jgi:hypothetical protein
MVHELLNSHDIRLSFSEKLLEDWFTPNPAIWITNDRLAGVTSDVEGHYVERWVICDHFKRLSSEVLELMEAKSAFITAKMFSLSTIIF